MTAMSRGPIPQLAVLMASAALALSACGSGGAAEADANDELATLETSDSADAADSESTQDVAEASTLTADEAALALSECLRGEGLDVPDIGVDANGNIDLRGAFQDLGPGDASFRDAMDVCREVLDGAEFGGGGRGALADDTEIQDAFLEFSDCIRAEGFEDIADLTFGRPDGGQAGDDDDGARPAPGQGDREGGFGDRTVIFAERLGLDPEDPAVIAALDLCSPIIDQAFSDAGVGEPGAGA